MVLSASDLEAEHVNTMALSLSPELGVHTGHEGALSKISNPEFLCCFIRRIDDKGLCFRAVSGSGFNSSDV